MVTPRDRTGLRMLTTTRLGILGLMLFVVGVLSLPACAFGLSWAPVPAPPDGADAATLTTLIGGKVLIAGGNVGGRPTAAAFVFDPQTLAWTATGWMHSARAYQTATRLDNGKVLVAGGEGDGGVLASSELYDPLTGTWTVAATMSHGLQGGRWRAEATLLGNGDVLLTDGLESNGKLDTWPEVYVPAPSEGAGEDSWFFASGEHLPARLQAGLTTLPDGRALLAGGSDSTPPSTPLSSAEIYEPGHGWTATEKMSQPQTDFLLTTLASGSVIALGTHTALYATPFGTWNQAPELIAGPARIGSSGTELPDGRLLVVGGCAGTYPAENTSDTETYDPATNSWSEAGALPAPRAQALVAGLGSAEALTVGGYEQPNRGYCNVFPSSQVSGAAAWPAPSTTITSSPPGSATVSGASFTFSADLAGSAFSCKLDLASFAACASPATYHGLTAGAHVFSVFATAPTGLQEPTPSVRQWSIAAPAAPEEQTTSVLQAMSPVSAVLSLVSAPQPSASKPTTQAQVLLSSQLVPPRHAAVIASLLAHAGLPFSFRALEAGTISIAWYYVASRTRAGGSPRFRVFASGKTTFSTAGAGTVRMRLSPQARHFLRLAKRVRLIARGKFARAGHLPLSASASFTLTR
jgi:hypothetical protein